MFTVILIAVGVIMIGLGFIGRIKNHFAKKNGEIISLPTEQANYNESPFNNDTHSDPGYRGFAGNFFD